MTDHPPAADHAWRALTAAQAAVAHPWLAARSAEVHHVVIYLSGAHAYGFPSPDSDLDLKCIHVAPTRALVGLSPTSDTRDRLEVVDGVELDYTSNELAAALRGAIKGNGNYLERLLGALVLAADAPLLAAARELVRPVLSRHVARHYRGFAHSQLEAFDAAPSAKRALYVLRTAATGRCLLATGVLETDVARLPDFVPPEIGELIELKQAAERQPLGAARVPAWRARLASAVEAIDAELARAVLPAEPPARAIDAIDAWLREVRRDHW